RKQPEPRPTGPAKPEVDQEKAKEEIERAAREAMERARKEAEEKASREAEALRLQLELERRTLEEAAQRQREEQERKRREEEEERRRQEEAERKVREEEERKRKEEEERKRREEDERRRKEEAERKAREEAERKRREEEERKRKEEAERKAREEAERRRKEEEERKRKDEEERKRKEEEDRKRREEEARKRREEEERRRKEEAERKAREDAERRRSEEQERARREEQERVLREEQEVARPEEQPEAAPRTGDAFAESLLADLESFSQRDEEQRKVREAAEREETEKAAREAEARRRRAEEDRTREPQLTSSIPPGGGEAPSSTGRAKRRLAAIVAADVVGYSRMMGQDEEGTLARMRGVLNDLIRPTVGEHGGHIVKTVGDGLLIEFASVVAAVRWAAESQQAVAESQAKIARDRQIIFRMGINLGDIIDDDNDVFGDGVNVASRLEGLADNGGICISSTVYDQIRDKVPYKFQDLGNQRFKNISRPVRVYRLKDEREEAEKARRPVLQDAATMEPATARMPREELDEIEVSEDDLRMDEVKRDEKVLTKEARKEARERAKEEKRRLKEEKRRLKAEQEPIKPIKIRRPRKWGRTFAVLFVLLVAGTLGAVHFAPVPTARYEKAASAAFGQPVKVGSAHMSLFRGLELVFERVTIGNVYIAKVHAFPEIGTLLGDQNDFRRIELDGPVVHQEDLGALVFGAIKPGGLKVGQIEATKLRLAGPVPLPALDADVRIATDGKLKSVTLQGADRLVATLTPKAGEVGFELNAGNFSLPFAPEVSLSSFTMKGTADRRGMSLSEWDGNVLDGNLSGTAQIQWGPVWTVEGKLKVHRINAAVFAPALLSEGLIEDGRGSYRMSGPNPTKLMEGAHIEGSFGMAKGVLGSFDLSRAIQTAGVQSQGRTIFAELSGEGVYDKGTITLRNVNIAAGALNAAASVEIAPGGALSARIVADMKTAGQTLRQTLNLTGTVKAPVVKENRK
ncbi:MAG: adenylate/guanylate cyclase domain-containing protein, partial [Burkholderiales bacterium]